MELDSVAKVTQAFYRLVGSASDDEALVEQGESVDDVAYLFLTRGCRAAQRWMLGVGYNGWRKRSAALVFTGTDSTIGGSYAALPDDYLQAHDALLDPRRSALVRANGDPWGQRVDDERLHGRGYYFKDDQLWLLRGATPSGTLYLDYHYRHPEWDADVVIDFPLLARPLIVAFAGEEAKWENWLLGGADLIQKIELNFQQAKQEARGFARQGAGPRRFKGPRRMANRY